MTPRRFLSHTLFALSAALLVGCGTTPKPDEPPASPVKWDSPSRPLPKEWTELVGVTQPLPNHVARVSAAIDGRVVSLLQRPAWLWVQPLHEGDEVARNEEIAQLDDRIARFNLAKAESAMKTAANDSAMAQTALNLASYAFAAKKALHEKTPSSVPEIDLKTAEGAEMDAQSKLQTAQQHQDQARKDYETAKAQLQLYTVTAPIQGRLSRVQATLGQPLTAGTQIAEVVDLADEIDVLCFVSRHAAARLHEGQDAGLGGLDEQKGEVRTAGAPGHVAYVSDKAEPESGCFAVKVRFPNKDAHLRGNTVQRVRVLTKPGEEQWCILETALMEDQDPPSVVIVEDVKTKKNSDGKEEQVGTAKRMRALIGVRDRVLKQVALLGLQYPDGNKWDGDMSELLVVSQKGEGLQTGDPVRLAADKD